MLQNSKITRIISLGTFSVYLLLLLRLAVFRDDFTDHGLFKHGTLSFVPFAVYMKMLKAHKYFFAFYQFAGNIIWFVPFGFLLPFLTGRPKGLKRVIQYGLLLSVVIELSQFAFGTGVTEIDDLILNTFGTALGFVFFRLLMRVKKQNIE